MRLYSTPESARNGEVTWLALAECVVSIAIYVAIGFYFHTFAHYAWAIAVAPFLLFRTDESSRWGLKQAVRFGEFIVKDRLASQVVDVIVSVGAFALWPVAGFAIRGCVTVHGLATTPFDALRSLPNNWVRQALATDLAHPPELLPLEASEGEDLELITFRRALSGNNEWWQWLILVPVLVGYIASFAYRISFKATALVYAPFVWITHTSLHTGLALKARLERFTKGELEKVRRMFSLFVLTIAALKAGVITGWFDLKLIQDKIPSPKLVNSLIDPTGFPLRQGALVADALITYVLFFLADAALARLEGKVWPEPVVEGAVATGTMIRNILAIAAIARVAYLAMLEVVTTGAWQKLFPGS